MNGVVANSPAERRVNGQETSVDASPKPPVDFLVAQGGKTAGDRSGEAARRTPLALQNPVQRQLVNGVRTYSNEPIRFDGRAAVATAAERLVGSFLWVGNTITPEGIFAVVNPSQLLPAHYAHPNFLDYDDRGRMHFKNDFTAWLCGQDGTNPTQPGKAVMNCRDFVYLCLYQAGMVSRRDLRALHYDAANEALSKGHGNAFYRNLGLPVSRPVDADMRRGDIVFFLTKKYVAHVAIVANPERREVYSLGLLPLEAAGQVCVANIDAVRAGTTPVYVPLDLVKAQLPIFW